MRYIFLLLVVAACTQQRQLTEEELEAHRAEVETWHTKRISNLKAPNGWLNLVGLHWLEPGMNTFGSDSGNALVFPQGKIATRAGYFLVKDNVVTLVMNEGVMATIDNDTIITRTIFHPDSTRAPQVQVGDLRWNIIKRDTKLGVRLRDDKAEALKTFTEIECYPIAADFRLEATMEYDSTRTIEITNVLGQTTPQRSPGTLVFEYQNKTYRLDALEEGDQLFIIFADATSGTETYGAGRYLYAKKPTGNGKVILDFNKAYNPPCVFTPHATCPLPPRQNVLPFAIRSGEKNYGAELH
jgi:uncharacterized protein (DUF1684 family)